MTQVTVPRANVGPQDDLKTVVQGRTREWHFHIYFLLQSEEETAAALALRDAVLRLRRDGTSSVRWIESIFKLLYYITPLTDYLGVLQAHLWLYRCTG
jgi:hypothetical protein